MIVLHSYMVILLAICVQWLADEFIPYLKEWESSVGKRSGFSSQSKSMMVVAKETRNGIKITGICYILFSIIYACICSQIIFRIN